MIKPLCSKCIKSIQNAPRGQGTCINICTLCDITAAVNYINNQKKKTRRPRWRRGTLYESITIKLPCAIILLFLNAFCQ